MRTPCSRLLVVAVVLSTTAPRAQVLAPAPQTADGRISGVVLAADSKQPLRGATVTLGWKVGPAAQSLVAVTDVQGRFAFIDLHTDDYMLQAGKPGYLWSDHARTSGAGPPWLAIHVSQAQRVGGIELPLLRAGAISGTVRDANGDAAPGAAVQLTRVRPMPNGDILAVGTVAEADDRGLYRFSGLDAGEYLVRPAPPSAGAFVQSDRTRDPTIGVGHGEERTWVDLIVPTGPRPDPASPSTVAGEKGLGDPAIFGTLVAADTGRPIAHGHVTLAGNGALPPSSSSAITDEYGRFHLDHLRPWSSYVLSAQADGFVEGSYRRDAGGGMMPWSPIAVHPGERVDGLIFVLRRIGVVSGIVRDESGDPVEGAAMSLLGRALGEDGQWQLIAQATSDDRGMYYLSVPYASEYLVSATPPLRTGGASIVSENRGPMAANASELAGPYAPVFYPGTPALHDAIRLRLGDGEQREALDISLVRTPTMPVAGRLVSPDQTPCSVADVFLDDPSAGGSRAIATGDGMFTLPNVSVGMHDVIARCDTRALFGSTTIVVDERQVWQQRSGRGMISSPAPDAPPITLTLHPGPRVVARVSLDTARPGETGALTVTLRPFTSLFPAESTIGLTWLEARTDEAGLVTFESVRPGRYTVDATRPTRRDALALLSATLHGVDIADQVIDVRSEDVTDLALVFTDRAPTIAGLARDAGGMPAAAIVFAISTTEDRGALSWTRIPTALVSSDGSFEVSRLRPGTYRVVAVSRAWNVRDSAALENLAAMGTLVTVGLGDRKTVELTVRQPRPGF